MQDNKIQKPQQFATSGHPAPNVPQEPDLNNVTYQDIKIKCNIDNYEEDAPQRSPIEQRCQKNANHLEHFQREKQFAVDSLQLNNQHNEKGLSDAMPRPAESVQSLNHSEQQSQRYITDQNSQNVRRAI